MEIEIKNLTKVYNKRTVLDIDQLTIHKGELIGLIGNNGTGKPTMPVDDKLREELNSYFKLN